MNTGKQYRLKALLEKMKPKFDEYAERHNGERPCVEDLILFLIEEENHV